MNRARATYWWCCRAARLSALPASSGWPRCLRTVGPPDRSRSWRSPGGWSTAWPSIRAMPPTGRCWSFRTGEQAKPSGPIAYRVSASAVTARELWCPVPRKSCSSGVRVGMTAAGWASAPTGCSTYRRATDPTTPTPGTQARPSTTCWAGCCALISTIPTRASSTVFRKTTRSSASLERAASCGLMACAIRGDWRWTRPLDKSGWATTVRTSGNPLT